MQDIDPKSPNYDPNASRVPFAPLPNQVERLAAWDAYTEKANAPRYTGNGKLEEHHGL